ncbi:MAG: hypothetical protein APF84_09925 [Gracilibacter sp. BRH_c7a]|nr:MAG: hypothetical protein APF84_09925 [Gracilibacter sp. BRH_c7a]
MEQENATSIQFLQKKKIELLAPAGSFEALKAAVENGADAVYLGGKLFNARASAANFDLDELKRAITYAHEREVKVYVTVNILVGDSEFSELADYIYDIYALGADAVIVQDLGVAHFIRSVLPEMEIHASTQMTQNNSLGLQQLEKIGFSRVVLARETSGTEIEKIIQQTKLEVEVFVHGALCISYSGQCLMSSYIGARSGNRGKCAQPCRLPYQLVGGKGKDLLEGTNTGEHLLSPRDLNLAEELAELKRIGVTSLKIEGRMKRSEYVATVVRIYRKALDALEQDEKENEEQSKQQNMGLNESDKYDLTQIFNRDFTTGYFKGYQGREMMSFSRPNNRGTRLGRIIEIRNNRMVLKLDNKLNLGDGIEIWTGRGREGMTVDRIFTLTNNTAEHALAGESVSLDYSGHARTGDRVFKTHDAELIEQARLSYQEGRETRKRFIKMKLSGKAGEKLLLQAWDRDKKAEAYSLTGAQEAVKRPLEYEYLFKQLGRLGNTPLFLEELELDLQGDIIIPVRELNEMRREVVEKLLSTLKLECSVTEQTYKERLKNWNRMIYNLSNPNVNADLHLSKLKKGKVKNSLSVAIRDVDLIEVLIRAGADRIILGGESWRSKSPITLEKLEAGHKACRSKGVEFIWRLPRITNEDQSARLKEELTEISSWQFRPTIMVANLAGIEIIQRIDPSWNWETDHFLHVYNKAALSWILGMGAERANLSSELNHDQLRNLILPSQTEILVFGDMEMMVSEYCPLEATLSSEGNSVKNCKEKCGTPCHKDEYFLQDRLSYRFPIETDRACRMHIFNAKRLNLLTELATITEMGIKNIRLELLRVTPLQAEITTRTFKGFWDENLPGINRDKVLDGMNKLENLYPEGFTKGHFYRGVLT